MPSADCLIKKKNKTIPLCVGVDSLQIDSLDIEVDLINFGQTKRQELQTCTAEDDILINLPKQFVQDGPLASRRYLVI